MSHKQVLQLVIAVILVMSFLVGCGGSTPTAVSEAPAATSEPEQAAATPTPEPPAATSTLQPPTVTPIPPTATPIPPTPEPPTATPTPAIANPQPDTTFAGAMEISQPGSEGTAKGGSLEFTITEDGNAIASVSITLTESKCSVTSGGATSVTESESSTTSFEGPFPIVEGKIDATVNKSGKFKGQFTSPTEANGNIDVVLTTVVGLATLVDCDLGEWNWSAKAGASSSTSDSSSETTTSITDTTSTTPQSAPFAILEGAIEMKEAGSNGKASGGTITFFISNDGTSIDYADITLTDVKCPSSSSQSLALPYFNTPSTIEEGRIELVASGFGKQTVTGQLISPTEAKGSATILVEIPLEQPCDLGTWDWSAKAK